MLCVRIYIFHCGILSPWMIKKTNYCWFGSKQWLSECYHPLWLTFSADRDWFLFSTFDFYQFLCLLQHLIIWLITFTSTYMKMMSFFLFLRNWSKLPGATDSQMFKSICYNYINKLFDFVKFIKSFRRLG